MEFIERDETLPISDKLADKLDGVIDVDETAELRQAVQSANKVVPFKPKAYPDAPRPKIPRTVTKYVTDIHSEFINSIAGTQDLKLALAKSDNKRAQDLLVSLLDPRKSKISVAQLVHRSGLRSLDLLDILRDHYIGSGLQEYMKGFREIAQDTVEDAKSSNSECPKCGGEGVVEVKAGYLANIKNKSPKKGEKQPKQTRECTLCSGTGLVRKSGDNEARKLIAQSLKVIQSGSGGSQVSVSINNSGRGFECVIDEVERQETTNRRKKQAEQQHDSQIIDVTATPAS